MSRRITFGVVVIALLLVACSSGSTTTTAAETTTSTAASDTGLVTVIVTEVDANTMVLTPSSDTAPVGEVTFQVTNSGKEEHEFVVLKTDLAISDLPFDDAADEVVEDGAGVTVVDEIGSILPGETKNLTVTFEAGSYVLFCNLEGHFRKGMRSAFTVN